MSGLMLFCSGAGTALLVIGPLAFWAGYRTADQDDFPRDFTRSPYGGRPGDEAPHRRTLEAP